MSNNLARFSREEMADGEGGEKARKGWEGSMKNREAF